MRNLKTTKFIVLTAVYIGVLVFFFIPSEIYIGNPREFISSRETLILSLAFAGLFCAVALSLPALVPMRRWREIYGILLGAAFLGLWVSGVFLIGDFGEFDGTLIDLRQHTKSLAIHSIWFTFAFATACLGLWRWPSPVTQLINIIGIGLFVIGITNFYVFGEDRSYSSDPVNLTEFTRFSTDRNLLIVLMDTFQSDVFQQIIDQDSHVTDVMDGFVFYPDTLGVAPSTYLTMPAFHSGITYNNTMGLSEYYEKGVREGSFLVEMASNGYQVDVINPIADVCPLGASTCEQQASLLLKAKVIIENEASRLADIGLLRVAPGFLKYLVFGDNIGLITKLRSQITLTGLDLRVYQGNSVLELMANNLWADNTAPTAKLIHLFNTHPPYMFDSDCQFRGTKNDQDRSNMTMQSKCAIKWFLNLLEQMKKHKVYANSMIILTADTGAGTIWGADDLSSLYAQEHGVAPGELGRLIGGANPVLSIKYPEMTGKMGTSPLQAQLADIPKTVCLSLQACTHDSGINLKNGKNELRKRPYNYYSWKNEYWGLNHIPGIVQYSVNGPLWYESSWSDTTNFQTPKEILSVSFSNEDQPDIFGSGWSHIELSKAGVSKRWSNAKRAELFLPLPQGEDLSMEFKVLMAPGLTNQVMSVQIDDETVGFRSLEEHVQFVTVTVPSRLIGKPVTKVILEFTELKEAKLPDLRDISVSFYALKIFQSH